MPVALTKKWHRFRNPWDREYAQRGVLWRGVEDASWLRAHLPEGSRIVDLACGDGKFLGALRQAGFDPWGLDYAKHGLRLAAGRAGTSLVLGDLRELPIRSASVDAAAARYGLGALRANDRQRASSEIRRVLIPGGLLLLEEFAPEDFRFGTGRPVEERTFERTPGVLSHYFLAGELEGLFAGWDLVSNQALESVQRAAGGTLRRRRFRVLLRKP